MNQEKLNTIATSIQQVETIAIAAVAAGATAPTSQQKLDAAIMIATTIDPTLQEKITPVKAIVSSLVGVFNLFGLFKKKQPGQAGAEAFKATSSHLP